MFTRQFHVKQNQEVQNELCIFDPPTFQAWHDSDPDRVRLRSLRCQPPSALSTAARSDLPASLRGHQSQIWKSLGLLYDLKSDAESAHPADQTRKLEVFG